MSDPKSKTTKSKAAKPATPQPPDLTGPDTFDLHTLHDLMRAVKPHAGLGIVAGASHLKNVYLKSNGQGRLQAICKGLGSDFTMTIGVPPEIPAFQEFVEPERLGTLLGLLKGDRVVMRFTDAKVELYSEGAESFMLRPAEIEGQRSMFAYAKPKHTESGIKVRAGDLLSVFSRVVKFVSRDTQRVGINGLHMGIYQRGAYLDTPIVTNPLEITGTPSAVMLRLAATDGHRLCLEHVDVLDAKDGDRTIAAFVEFFRTGYIVVDSLPSLAAYLNLLSPDSEVWLSGLGDKLSLYSSEYEAHLEISKSTFEFPEYWRVLPRIAKDDALVTGPLGEYIAEANRFAALCRAHGEEITRTSFLAVYKDCFEFRQSYQSFGENPHVFVQVPIKSTGKEPLLYGINRVLWSDSMNALLPEHSSPDDKIMIRFATLEWRLDPKEPICATRGADFDTPFNTAKVPFVIVMPMKVN